MNKSSTTTLIAKLRYQAKQYTSGCFARGGSPSKHYLDEAADVIEILRTAIHKTLDDNAHLADGENCTLMALKIALREIGEPWEDESWTTS
jgi:hypothetical protein